MSETTTSEQTPAETPKEAKPFLIDDPVKAINILISAVERAQLRGAFNLQESKMIYDAVTFFDKSKTIEAINAEQTPKNEG